MAAKNTLEIIIKANATQAQAALAKLQTTVGKPFTALQANVSKLGTAFTSLTGFSLGAAGAFAAVGMAASKATDFIKESVTQTVQYAQQVRELSYVLGTNAEETSRLIQVADDYLISTEKLTTALKFAVKNGYAPTVESIAQLADRFNSISDPTQRAAEMVQIFGRNWSALVPLLQAGGDAIRENAAAVNDALVLNDAQVQATFEYQQALDNLEDSINGVKTSIGMSLVPALNDALGVINQLTPALNLLDDVMGGNVVTAFSLAAALALLRGDFSLQGFAESARLLNQGFEASQKSAELAAQATGDYGQRLKEINGTLADAGGEAEDLSDSLQDYSKVVKSLNLSTQQENAMMEQFAAGMGAVDAGALTLANDIDLLNAAVQAGVITIPQWTDYMKQAANGTLELTPAMRDATDQAIEQAKAMEDLAQSSDAAANAVSSTRSQIIGLAEQLRFAGPREVRNQIFDQLVGMLQTVDPAKAEGVATGIEDIGLAFGKFNANDLAVAEALPQFVQQLFGGISTGEIDPTTASEAVQAFLDAVRELRTTGEDLDVESILAPFRLEEAGITVDTMLPATILADEIGRLAELAPTAGAGMDTVANASGAFAETSSNLNETLKDLPSRVEILGEKAKGAYTPMKDLASAIGDTAKSAQTATGAVNALAIAIAALSDKTVTITANVKLNDPLGLFGSGGQGGGVNLFQPQFGVEFQGARGAKVLPGQIGLVGEEGPELFIPQSAGNVIPNDVTQAAILAAMQGFAPGREGTPETRNQERARQRRQRRGDTQPETSTGPDRLSLPNQPVPAFDPRFLGENLDAYMEFFQAANSLAPGIRAIAAQEDTGSSPQKRRRRRKSWREGGGWTTEVEDVINTTYQQFTGGAQSLKLPQVIGEIETNQGVNAGDAETVRNPNGVVNNYFPISRVDDELDARQLARLVAAEMARMPSR